MKSRPILYIKSGCPWCTDAISYFERQGVKLDVKDVLQDNDAKERMKKISGQTLTPTFEYGDFIVADFDVSEFATAAKKQPEIAKEIGIQP